MARAASAKRLKIYISMQSICTTPCDACVFVGGVRSFASSACRVFRLSSSLLFTRSKAVQKWGIEVLFQRPRGISRRCVDVLGQPLSRKVGMAPAQVSSEIQNPSTRAVEFAQIRVCVVVQHAFVSSRGQLLPVFRRDSCARGTRRRHPRPPAFSR